MTEQNYTDEAILKSDAPLHSIGKTSEITGVNAITLRAWERRYGIVNPTRTLRGHRLYSNADISRINRATSLVKQGIQISQVPKILAQELGPLLDIIPPANRSDQLEWQAHKEIVMTCLENRDLATLSKLHHQLFDNYSASELHEMLCNSILGELKIRGEEDPKLAGPYYTYLSYLNAFLGHRSIVTEYLESNPRILVINRSEAYHTQLRCLWYVLVLADGGFNTGLLDQNPPFEAILESARTKKYAGAIIIRHPTSDVKIIEEQLAPILPVFMIGEHYEVNQSAPHKITLLPRIISENIAILKQHIK